MHALHVHMSMCLTSSRVNVSCMLMCSHANVPYMLMCLCANVPRMLTSLRANMLSMLICLHAIVPVFLHALCAYLLMCSYALLTCSYANMSCVLMYSCVKMSFVPKCSRAITLNNKNKFSVTCFTQILRFLCLFSCEIKLFMKSIYNKQECL